MFGCNNDRHFLEKYTVKFSFFPQKARVNNQRVPPGHPINLINSVWPPYRLKGLLAT